MKNNNEILDKIRDLSEKFVSGERNAIFFIGTTESEKIGDNQRHYGCVNGDEEAIVYSLVRALEKSPEIPVLLEKAMRIFNSKQKKFMKEN
jgi:hypothetical protein